MYIQYVNIYGQRIEINSFLIVTFKSAPKELPKCLRELQNLKSGKIRERCRISGDLPAPLAGLGTKTELTLDFHPDRLKLGL